MKAHKNKSLGSEAIRFVNNAVMFDRAGTHWIGSARVLFEIHLTGVSFISKASTKL